MEEKDPMTDRTAPMADDPKGPSRPRLGAVGRRAEVALDIIPDSSVGGMSNVISCVLGFLVGYRFGRFRNAVARETVPNVESEAKKTTTDQKALEVTLQPDPASYDRRRTAILVFGFVLAGVLTTALGLHLLPPSYDATHLGYEPLGTVEVFVSDPRVKVELDVQIFDWADWISDPAEGVPNRVEDGNAVRMILWLRNTVEATVNWAVVLSGDARYVFDDGLAMATSPEPIEDVPEIITGAWISEEADPQGNDVQVIRGTKQVGSDSFTERAGDWDGRAIGIFRRTTGAWPDYGSKSTLRLPAYRLGMDDGRYLYGIDQTQAFLKFEPPAFYVGYGPSSLPTLMRVDWADPPLTGTSLSWVEADLWSGPRAAFTDISAEQEESFRSSISGAVLGFSGGAYLAAFAFLSEAWASRRFRSRRKPTVVETGTMEARS
jgi:hypothetical protein